MHPATSTPHTALSPFAHIRYASPPQGLFAGCNSRDIPPPAAVVDCRPRRSIVLAKWPIRNKLLLMILLLAGILILLTRSSLYGLYAYRDLVNSLSRFSELRLATELADEVSDLRVATVRLNEIHDGRRDSLLMNEPDSGPDFREAREDFRRRLSNVEAAVAAYHLELKSQAGKLQIGGHEREFETVSEFETVLARIRRADRDHDWVFDKVQNTRLEREVDRLQLLSAELPSYLHQSILDFTNEVRSTYRWFIGLAWTTLVLTLALLGTIVWLAYNNVFRPLRTMVEAARKLASGMFHQRVQMSSKNEMAELAGVLNETASRFSAVRDDLDRQVKERTRQIVRSERLAGVGFLAAGVSHEINNPLASIALCAESLEMRLRGAEDAQAMDDQADVVKHYLKMIRSEATRCQQITHKLVDFSRIGESIRASTDLRTLVVEVVEMVGHLGRYRDRNIALKPGPAVLAEINPQEIKQVVLNLLTNALESTPADGTVELMLTTVDGQAQLHVKDNGCGMTDEVLEHLFEPFFTRRAHGQGTGLGLSIAHRIVANHGGEIKAESAGPERGSTFVVSLPLESAPGMAMAS